MFRHVTTYLLLTALIFMSMFPHGIAQARGGSGEWEQPKLENLPPFPEDAQRAPIDWSTVDWEQEITLPGEQRDFDEQLEQLEQAGLHEQASALSVPTHRMSDQAVMDYYQVPEEIQKIVQWHQVTYSKLIRDDVKQDLKKYTRLKIRAKQAELGIQSSAKEGLIHTESGDIPVIDLRTAPRLNVTQLREYRAPNQDSVRISVPHEVKNQIPDQSTLKKPKKVSYERDKRFSMRRAILSFFATPAYAYYAPTTPIISSYNGIEEHPIENVLYYLSRTQNEDGSWGAYRQYEITGNVALLLSSFNKIDSDQYAFAIQYLKNAAPKDDRERAFKARLMYRLGEEYQPLLNSVLAHQKGDGGFGLTENLLSDAETTLEVAYALQTTGYRDEDFLSTTLLYVVNQIEASGVMRYNSEANPSYHLINKTLTYFEPFQNETLLYDGGSIAVQDKIDALLGYLADHVDAESGDITDSGDLIDTLETLESFQLYRMHSDLQAVLFDSGRTSQNTDGSFGSSLFASVAAMRALSQPDIEIISMQPVGSLVNRSQATFEIAIKNAGYLPMSNMHLYDFIDGYQLNQGYDIGSWGVSLAPGQQTTLTIVFNDTVSFINDTEIKFYLEGVNEYSYENNWITSTYSFAANAQATPALPMYYIAQKYNSGALALVNIRWQVKEDENRMNYVLMYRETGTPDWSYRGIDTTWNGAFFGVFDDDVTYDITAGVLHLDETTVTSFSDVTEVHMSGDETKYLGGASGIVTVNNTPTPNIGTWAYGVGSGDLTDENGEFSIFDLPQGTTAGKAYRSSLEYFEELTTRFAITDNATTTDIRLFTRYKDDAQAPVITDFWIPFNYSNTIKNREGNILQVLGTDNVALKEADFYYWDPVLELWLYIGTQSAIGGSIEHNWYVSQELEGSGYQIRAVLRDWQGNESASVSWGPFEIKDSTPPEGTVSIQNIVDGQWAAGEEKTIQWDITARNGLLYFPSIKLHYGDRTQGIAYDVAVSQTLRQYTIPPYSGYVTSEAYLTIEACDVNLNCATFQTENFSVTDTSEPPDAPWDRPNIFAGLAAQSGIDRYLEAIFHPGADRLEIVYTEYEGVYSSEAGQYRRIMHRTFTSGAWQDPDVMFEYWYHSGETPEVIIHSISAARTDDGNVHVVYEKEINTASSYENLDNVEIFYAHLSGHALVADRQISDSSTNTNSPRVLAASDGTVSVFWRQGHSYVSSSGTVVLQYASGDGASSWSAPSAITSTQTSAYGTGFDSSDNPVVLYQSSGSLYATALEGGIWSSSAQVAADDAENVSNVNLFYYAGDVYDVFYRYGSSSTNWKYTVRHIQFSLDALLGTASVLVSRDAVPLSGVTDVRAYAIMQNSSKEYHLAYITPRDGVDTEVHCVFYNASGTHFDAYVSSLLMSVEQGRVELSEFDDAVSVYFFGFMGGREQWFSNAADFSESIASLGGIQTGIRDILHSTTNHEPGASVTHTTTFDPGESISAPGEVRIQFLNEHATDFDLRNVYPPADISVSGGGVVWDAVETTALNNPTRTITLGFGAGRLTPGAPVIVSIRFIKNPPQLGEYTFELQEGTQGFAAPLSSRMVASAVAQNTVSVSAFVPYDPANPVVMDIAPMEIIIISSGSMQEISFRLVDVNFDEVEFSLTSSSGTISVAPSPASPITSSPDGVVVTFTYTADGGAGAQTITVTADDHESDGGGVVTEVIDLFIF